MAIFKSKDGTGLILNCHCGCDESIRFQIVKEDLKYLGDQDAYAIMTYMNGKFYAEQGETFREIWRKKLKKIWAILRNRDYYYADVYLTKDDMAEFKEYVNSSVE